MPLKLFFLNMVFVTLFIWIGLQIYDTWTVQKQATLISSEEEISPRKEIDKKLYPKNTLVESSYNVIVNRNLFSPERKTPVIEEQKAGEAENIKKVRVTGKNIALFGVFMINNGKMALINNPSFKPGGEKYKWVYEGERFANIQIDRIEKEAITISEKGKKYKIVLYNPNKRKANEKKAEQSIPTIIIADPEGMADTKKKDIATSNEAAVSKNAIVDTEDGLDANKISAGSSNKKQNSEVLSTGHASGLNAENNKGQSSKSSPSKIINNPFKSLMNQTRGKNEK